MNSQALSEITAIIDQFAALLIEVTKKAGVTDVTAASDGVLSIRANTRIESMKIPWLEVAWNEIAIGLLGLPPWKQPKNPQLRANIKVIQLGNTRFRCTWSRHSRGETISIRPLPSKIKTPAELNLNPILEQTVAAIPGGGLVIFCGATGSGKTTSLASLMEHRAKTVGGKFITLENPIEFLHESTSRAIFYQRQVGENVESYRLGLEEALVENPNVISVQELRDSASAEIALSAALSGHLVFTTLHANDAASVPERLAAILGLAQEQKGSAMVTLSMCLEMIVGIRLVPGAEEGLIPALDIITMREHPLSPTRSSKMISLIAQGSYQSLRSEQVLGKSRGMMTFEESISELATRGLIAV